MEAAADSPYLNFGRSVLRKKTDVLVGQLAALKRHPTEDAIHETRVQSRRMRAALEAFRDLCESDAWDPAYESIRWITRTLGRLRESEVMASMLQEDVLDGDTPEKLCREYLQERLKGEIRKMRRKLRKRLKRIDVKELRSQLKQLISGLKPEDSVPPDGSPASRGRLILGELAQPVVEFKARYRFSRAGDRQLHRLRIATKKLRYAMEIFDEVWPGGLQRPIEAARGLQEAAGRHQDWAVLRDTLRSEIRRLTREETTTMAFQMGRLLNRVQDHKAELRKQVLSPLVEFQSELRNVLADSAPEPVEQAIIREIQS